MSGANGPSRRPRRGVENVIRQGKSQSNVLRNERQGWSATHLHLRTRRGPSGVGHAVRNLPQGIAAWCVTIEASGGRRSREAGTRPHCLRGTWPPRWQLFGSPGLTPSGPPWAGPSHRSWRSSAQTGAPVSSCINHDTLDRLHRIRTTTLIVVGDEDISTPARFATTQTNVKAGEPARRPAIVRVRDRSAGIVLAGEVTQALRPPRDGFGHDSRYAFPSGIPAGNLPPSEMAFVPSGDADINAGGQRCLLTGFVECPFGKNPREENPLDKGRKSAVL